MLKDILPREEKEYKSETWRCIDKGRTLEKE
jgi:hypothetical protein